MRLLASIRPFVPAAAATLFRNIRDRRMLRDAFARANQFPNRDHRACVILKALAKAASRSQEPDEMDSLAMIASRRHTLMRSTQVVEMVDYGVTPGKGPVRCRRRLGEIAGVSKSEPWGRFL